MKGQRHACNDGFPAWCVDRGVGVVQSHLPDVSKILDEAKEEIIIQWGVFEGNTKGEAPITAPPTEPPSTPAVLYIMSVLPMTTPLK